MIKEINKIDQFHFEEVKNSINHEKIDTGNNSFQCKCGKSYKDSKGLKYHIMIFNGEKPYKFIPPSYPTCFPYPNF